MNIGLIPLGQLLAIDDRSLNVLLFIPLDLAIGILPWSHPKAFALVLAALLPLGVESAQLLVPALGRACQASDVADNLSGLAAGFIAGLALRVCLRVVRWRRSPRVSRERQ